MTQVFISISAVGFVILCFVLPETKGLSLEQVGKIFGDEDEAAMYREDAGLNDEKTAGKFGQTSSGDRSGDEVGDAEKDIGTQGVERHDRVGEEHSV